MSTWLLLEAAPLESSSNLKASADGATSSEFRLRLGIDLARGSQRFTASPKLNAFVESEPEDNVDVEEPEWRLDRNGAPASNGLPFGCAPKSPSVTLPASGGVNRVDWSCEHRSRSSKSVCCCMKFVCSDEIAKSN